MLGQLIIICFFLAFIIYAPICSASRCPPPTMIEPCVCSDSRKIISCNVRGSLDLSRIFMMASFHMKRLRHPRMFNGLRVIGHPDSRAQITELGENIFYGLKFKNIDFHQTEINYIHPNAFRSTNDYTKALRITYGRLGSTSDNRTIPHLFEALSKLVHIEEIDISNNFIKQIPMKAFHARYGNQSNLKEVILNNNLIEEIGRDAFLSLSGLTRLNLEDNQIARIESESFSFENSTSIIKIQLSGNQLNENSFEDDALDASGRPINFIIEHNQFHSLTEEPFKAFLDKRSENIFDLGYNSFNCDCRLRWLLNGRSQYEHRVKFLKCKDNRFIWAYGIEELTDCH